MKFETECIKSSLCDYCDAFTLVTGDTKVNLKEIDILRLKIEHHFVYGRGKLIICVS